MEIKKGKYTTNNFVGLTEVIHHSKSDFLDNNLLLKSFQQILGDNFHEEMSFDEIMEIFSLNYSKVEDGFILKLDEFNKVHINKEYYIHYITHDVDNNVYLCIKSSYGNRNKIYK